MVTKTPLLLCPPEFGPLSRSEKKIRGGIAWARAGRQTGIVHSNKIANKKYFMILLYEPDGRILHRADLRSAAKSAVPVDHPSKCGKYALNGYGYSPRCDENHFSCGLPLAQ